MGHQNEKESVSLEALLRIKREERPESEFWDSFDSDFQRRRLSALVEKESVFQLAWSPLLKFAMLGAPALLLFSLAVIWTDEKPVKASNEIAKSVPVLQASLPEGSSVAERSEQSDLTSDLMASRLSSQFVVDAIQSDPERGLNFRKVLYTPAIHLSPPSGSSYIRDNLSARGYQVTTADLKLGHNF